MVRAPHHGSRQTYALSPLVAPPPTPVKFFSLLAILVPLASAAADVRLPAILSDHMVLCRTERVPIWGWADPGEDVTVTFGEQMAKTKATPAGKWRVDLDLASSGPGPFELTVEGNNRLVVKDVVVGDVWVASGQSNMDWRVSQSLEANEETARDPNPLIRQFSVRQATAMEPAEDCEGQWIVASPATVGEFTAIGYFFAKSLSSQTGRPVGLLHASWGGMNIERWIGERGFAGDPTLQTRSEEILEQTRASMAEVAAYQTALEKWETARDRTDVRLGDASTFAAPDSSTAGWQPVTLPGTLADAGLPDAGAIWLRRTVDYPKVLSGTQLNVGYPDGFVEAYWNGDRVGNTSPDKLPPGNVVSFFVAENQIHPGSNTIALRLFQSSGGAGISRRDPKSFQIDYGRVKLDGEWLAKVERALPALSPDVLQTRPATPVPVRPAAAPSSMFNAMVHPLIPYAINGILWYQGESNTERAAQYATALPLLINGWRQTWDCPDAVFLICQLANYQKKTPDPGESNWAELREAQSRALALPRTGLAVLIDQGEADDIHPRSKKEAGHRLALAARALSHGEAIPFSGPVFDSQEIVGDTIRIIFRHIDGGLAAQPLPETFRPRSNQPETLPLVKPRPASELQGFAICGEDRKWVWADARIDGDEVVVSSPDVPAPVAVRYAWADNPTCNLVNATGLPAVPFRTDDFPLTTRDAKY